MRSRLVYSRGGWDCACTIKESSETMIRGRFLSVLVVAAVVISCAPARPPRIQSADPEARALIEQLASRYPPLYENGYLFGAARADGGPDEARDADYDRVQAAYNRLKSMGILAFPQLVAASDDPRYSFSRVVAANYNLSIGNACFEIVASQVLPGGYGYKSRKGAGGRDASNPQYDWNRGVGENLKKWWVMRKGRSLAEVQISVARWTIAREQAIGFIDETQRNQVLRPLLARLRELGAPDALSGIPAATLGTAGSETFRTKSESAAPAHADPSPAPPPIVLGQIAIDGPLSGWYHVSAPDVEAYVRKYEDRGWMAGLTDERSLDDVLGLSGNPSVKRIRQEHNLATRPTDVSPPSRVSEVFVSYYLKQHDDVPIPKLFDREQQREATIQQAIRQVRRRLMAVGRMGAWRDRAGAFGVALVPE
jgi:hypothetical protein